MARKSRETKRPADQARRFTPRELRALALTFWERDLDADETTVARDRRVARALELAATLLEEARIRRIPY